MNAGASRGIVRRLFVASFYTQSPDLHQRGRVHTHTHTPTHPHTHSVTHPYTHQTKSPNLELHLKRSPSYMFVYSAACPSVDLFVCRPVYLSLFASISICIDVRFTYLFSLLARSLCTLVSCVYMYIHTVHRYACIKTESKCIPGVEQSTYNAFMQHYRSCVNMYGSPLDTGTQDDCRLPCATELSSLLSPQYSTGASYLGV